MVGSHACNLFGMDDMQRISHGEDAFTRADISL